MKAMKKPREKPTEAPSLRELYPQLTEAQLERAELNFRQYVESAVEVYERILADPEASARFRALLRSQECGRTGGKVDKHANNKPHTRT